MTRRRRKANRTSFQPGFDPRRHIFTAEERRRGGQTAWRRLMQDAPWMLAWLQRRINQTTHPATRLAYQQRRRCA
jgi:hypothetical protein